MYEVFERLLEMKGVSVADVSRATGISQSTLSNWKKRRNRISASNAEKLANYFGVSVGYIFGVQENEQTKEYFDDVASAELAQQMFDDEELRALHHIKKNIPHERFRAYFDMILSLYLSEHPNDNIEFEFRKQTKGSDDV
jgi:transcriptional regulator with XRE-family HTH domain